MLSTKFYAKQTETLNHNETRTLTKRTGRTRQIKKN